MQAANNAQAADNARCLKYHTDTFIVCNPGLLTNLPAMATARMITCPDTQGMRLYCEDHPNVDEKRNHLDMPAIVFEVKGSLRHEPDFYFTIRSDQNEPGFEADASSRCINTSCWLGPPADGGLENAVWRQGLRRLQAIGRKDCSITSELIRWSPLSVVRKAVKESHRNPMSYMPVYDKEENQRPFRMLSEVPFSSRICICFMLESGRPEGWDESKPDIMAARLLAMHIL